MQVYRFLTVCLLLQLVEELQAANSNPNGCREGNIQPFDQNEGRVKYCHNGKPRFVCSHGWSNEDATVVCRQMGLPTQGATLIDSRDRITSEVLSEVILTDPQCFGNEQELKKCLNPIPPEETLLINCSYAVVRCGPPPPEPPGLCPPEEIVWLRQRLMQTQEGGEREVWRVMYCLDGVPMDVCNSEWGTEEATVVCRQLGLPTEGATLINDGALISEVAAPQAVLYDPQCSGEEPKIVDCPNLIPAPTVEGDLVGCPYAAVSCREAPACTDEDIELEASGQLEICVEGELRPVCSIGWTDDAAGIVCRQLQLAPGGELEFGRLISTEEEAAEAVLTETDCAGTEQSIAECVSPGPGQPPVGCPYVTISCEEETPSVGELFCTDVREGFLPFLVLGDTPGVDLQLLVSSTGDIATSPPIAVPGGIPFGDRVHDVVFVSADGLFSLSEPYTDCCPSPFPLEDVYMVAPYWSDVDIRLEGEVRYEVHTWSNPDSWSLLTNVSSFLSEQAGFVINGTWMLVAKWDGVHPFPHGSDNTPSDFLLRQNTFQGVIITDEENQTFAIFTYECGLLEWSDSPASLNQHAVIGYTAPGGFYSSHPLSGTADVTSVSCAACPRSIWSNLVYDLTASTGLPEGPDIIAYGPAERCSMNESGVDISDFGRCEPFVGGSDFCDSLFENTGLYVYIPDSRQPLTQQDLHDVINEHFEAINNADINNDADCMQMILGVVCRHYYIPCVTIPDPVDAGLNFLPISVCPEECTFVKSKCGQLWFLVQSLTTISLPHLDFINCSNPDADIEPVPNCCVGAGVTIMSPTPTTLAPDPNPAASTVRDTTALITGVSIGTTAVFVLIVVVVIVCVVLKRRRNKIEGSSDLALDSFQGFGDDGSIERRGTGGNPYTRNPNPFPSAPKPLTQQNTISMEYLEQIEISESMLISRDDIRLLDSIGQGEFGIVYKGHLMDSMTRQRESFAIDIVAVKTLKGFFDESHAKDILDESAKMISFDHPHVLGLIGVCVDAGPAPYLVMPFMANGSLLSYLKANRQSLVLPQDEDQENVTETQKKTLDMCIQIAKGMEYLANKKFVHRDLAARNCMIDTNFVIKVADFGLSEDVYERNYFRQKESAVKLPIKWMALESTTDGVFSEKTDVWSFGVTCWEIYSGGKTPYAGVDPMSLIELLEAGRRLDKPMNAACSDDLFSVMTSCWSADPSMRPLFANLVTTISKLLAPLADYMDCRA